MVVLTRSGKAPLDALIAIGSLSIAMPRNKENKENKTKQNESNGGKTSTIQKLTASKL